MAQRFYLPVAGLFSIIRFRYRLLQKTPAKQGGVFCKPVLIKVNNIMEAILKLSRYQQLNFVPSEHTMA